MKRALKAISDGVLKVQKGWVLVDIMRVDSIRIRGCGYADIERLGHLEHLEHLPYLEHLDHLGHLEHLGHLGHLGDA